MAILMSTALKNEVLFNRSLISTLDWGVIRIYSGDQADSADAAPTGTLLASVTTSGIPWVQTANPAGGLRLAPFPQVGYIVKPSGQIWVLTAAESGTAGWWRFQSPLDLNWRIDGSVTGPFEELFIGNPVLTQGEQRFIETFQIGFYW